MTAGRDPDVIRDVLSPAHRSEANDMIARRQRRQEEPVTHGNAGLRCPGNAGIDDGGLRQGRVGREREERRDREVGVEILQWNAIDRGEEIGHELQKGNAGSH